MSSRSRAERVSLRAVADVCGRLLLREANAADLELMHRPELAGALAALGVDVPLGATEAVLERLAQEYFEFFRREGAEEPPVASLWRQSQAGDSAAAARRAAAAAGVQLDRGLERDAPIDHIGSLLVLWARTDESSPEVAELLRIEHLAWGIDALHARALVEDAGFYPSLARAAIAVLARVTGPEGAAGRA
jgi:TorA maturation chaperone TorD